MKVLLAHPGTQYSGRIATQLSRLGVLDEFHTGIAVADGGLGQRLISRGPRKLKRLFANRQLRGVASSRLHLHPADEIRAYLRQRRGASIQQLLHERNSRFQDRIADSALNVDAVIGFDTSSWKLAERCRRLGVPFILDQSIGHPDSKARVYEELRMRYPAWSHDADSRLPAVREAEQVEHDLARIIVAASGFSRKTLLENGIAPDKVVVNPYGVDCGQFAVRSARRTGPARFCFIGSITVRKGVPQLLETWKALGPSDAELWLIGPANRSAARLVEGHRNVIYKGAVAHHELPSLLAECDAFVFPSFFEGFALVILEAMACGLPVITTDATAGPDIIRDNEDGWIVRAGDDEGLGRALEHCLSHPAKVAQTGILARRTAEKFTWDSYGDRWLATLNRVAS